MSVESIGAVSDSTNVSSVNQSSLGQEEFLGVLLTQLSYQDPLSPMDNKEFIAQLAQFSGLEQTRQMNEKMDTALMQQSSNQAIGLLGKTVEIRTTTGSSVANVIAVSFQQGLPTLTLSTEGNFVEGVSLSQVQLVR